jgi:ATP-binding protein involved in chromosome partitioning
MSEAGGPDRAAILEALDKVRDPRSGQGLTAAGLVRGLDIKDGRAMFMLEAPAGSTAVYAPVRDAAEKALAAVAGVTKAQVVLTSEAARKPEPQRRGARVADDPQARLAPPAEATRPDHVRRVIAVASGKGGVGKSTVAVNLAAAFAGLGLSAGLLDVDIYGPSAPQMLGVDDDPEYGADKKLRPLSAWGVKVMSIGFMMEPGAANIWRGPMASSAVRTMAHNVVWGTQEAPMDVLVVDLPPGTGDIHLTLVQRLKIDGVVIVSTPQELALIDARRAAAMFTKTGTPLLGVVENMAFFPDPATGAPIPIFGSGGAKAEAERLGLPVLAEIPIDMALREGGDAGAPVAAAAPDSPAGRLFLDMARRLI